MTQFKLMITNEGKHPASKWAEITTDEIIEIGTQSPTALLQEAKMLRSNLLQVLTRHHQHMMDHEQHQMRRGGNTHLDMPYDTEEHTEEAVNDICELTKTTSFADHFKRKDVIARLNFILNKHFKSSKLVERQHYRSTMGLDRSETPEGTQEPEQIEPTIPAVKPRKKRTKKD